MSRNINLESLYQIINCNEIYSNDEIIKNFLATLDNETKDITNIQIKNNEFETFACLYKQLRENLSEAQKSGFYYGYKNSRAINQEFDLLKFSEKYTLNIELKSKLQNGGEEKLLKTLQRQNHVLLNCTKEVINYAYVQDIDKLYKLDSKKDDELTETTFTDLAEHIPENYLEVNLLEELLPSDLIISPYTEPGKFKEKSYYLNQEQENVVNNILKSNDRNICISGSAGTGKSLVLFELASRYQAMNKNVIIVFCGKLNDLNIFKGIFKFEIKDIVSIKKNLISLEEYDVVLFDEFQRIRKEQYEEIINLNLKLAVFSIDQAQTLHHYEIKRDIKKLLDVDFHVANFKLRNKIRQDPAMSSFIKKLLNPTTKGIQPTKFDKVTVKYFDEKSSAIEYLKYMGESGKYTIIELTMYKTRQLQTPQRENLVDCSKNTHEVIGEEFNNVIVVFDEHISFNDTTAKLESEYKKSKEYKNYPYDEHNCYFEALTRVKDKLEIVIVKNPNLYSHVLEILNWWKNDLNESSNKLIDENNNLKEQIKELENEIQLLRNNQNQN